MTGTMRTCARALGVVSMIVTLTIAAESRAWLVTSLGGRIAAVPGGDVLALGLTTLPGSPRFVALVARLGAARGDELWRIVPDPGVSVAALALHPSGDAILVGSPGVLSVDSMTGAERWRTSVLDASSGSLVQVAVNAAGDVGAGASSDGVVKLDGATGALRWQVLPGFPVKAVAVDDAGDVLAAGLPAGQRAVRGMPRAARGLGPE